MKGRLAAVLFRVVAALPLPVVRGLGGAIGLFLWLARGREALVTQTNLGHCVGDRSPAERRRLARRSLAESGRTGIEIIKVLAQPFERTARCVTVRNKALFDAALTAGRGVMVLVPHLGNWEVVGLWCAAHGPMTSLYRPPRQRWLEPLLRAGRERTGAALVPAGAGGVRALVTALRSGAIVGILPDQEPAAGSGVYAPFFGVPALTMTLAGRLAARTGCAIVTASARRVPGGFELQFDAADPAVAAADREIAAAALNRSVEASIRRAIEQYHWEYKRFKRRPPGAPAIYKK